MTSRASLRLRTLITTVSSSSSGAGACRAVAPQEWLAGALGLAGVAWMACVTGDHGERVWRCTCGGGVRTCGVGTLGAEIVIGQASVDASRWLGEAAGGCSCGAPVHVGWRVGCVRWTELRPRAGAPTRPHPGALSARQAVSSRPPSWCDWSTFGSAGLRASSKERPAGAETTWCREKHVLR